MLKEKLKLIPHLPGSYQMKNSDGTIIYVGKAKDLFKRVNSYFNRPQTGKTAKMVSEIADFSYIVASSELEAFLLEFNLLKSMILNIIFYLKMIKVILILNILVNHILNFKYQDI